MTADQGGTVLFDAQAAADEEERRAFVFNPFDNDDTIDATMLPAKGQGRRRTSTNATSLRSSSSSSGFSLIDVRAALPSPSLPLHMQSSSSSHKARSHSSSNNSPIASIFPGEELVSSPGTNVWLETRSNSSSSHNSVPIEKIGQLPLSKQPSTMSFGTAPSGQPPVAGFRIPATGSATLASFPLLDICGPAFKDKTGQPIYVCSAILGNSVHPAKCGPHLTPPVRWSFGGQEKTHDGRFDLVPITSDMKWVSTSAGKIPEGYTPVQGGYEVGGEQLYHAVAKISGVWCPGKTGLHLGGANFPWHNGETRLKDGYRILCWLPNKPVIA